MAQAGILLANPSGQGNFLIGLIAILIGGSMWGCCLLLNCFVFLSNPML